MLAPARIACKARELGDDQRLDVSALDVPQHALRLRVIEDGLPGHARQIIDLAHLPSLGRGIVPRTREVMFRAFALRLLVSRDSNPDTDWDALVAGREGRVGRFHSVH